MNLSFWVPGEPATFATSGERAWRDHLMRKTPTRAAGVSDRGVILEYECTSSSRRGQPFDIDNLCDPVFSILVNSKGWFGGHRPNILWWRAARHLSTRPGCHITVFSTKAQEIDVAPETVQLDAVFQGPLPADAKDPVLSSWLKSIGVKSTRVSDPRFGVRICFHETRVNLGDIATGPVKHVLDCLYPVLGGNPGSPEDWRVELLQVEKNCDHLQNGTFKLKIWVI